MTKKSLAVEDQISQLLRTHNITKAQVPVDRLIRLHGIKIVMKSMDNNVSGFILQEERKTLIAINSFHPAVRQRFTMAHELGHFLLKHQPRGMIVDDNDFPLLWRDDEAAQGTNAREREANAFASSLLMPREFLEKDLRHLRNVDTHNDTFIKTLAKKYGVSPQAMLLRISRLSNFRSQ